MKSIITIAAIALLQLSAIAQPVLNSSNVAQNFNAEFYYKEATGFSPGGAGPNQTWDYSNLGELMFLGTDTAIPVAGSAFAAMFPTANYLYKFEGIFGDADNYFYHNLTATKFEILSLGYNGETGDVFTPNPKTYVTFPYTYNTVFTDTYQMTTETSPTSFTATYDGYGTLIMPFGTFTNVIRQKVVTNGQTDYNYFNVSPFYPILQTVLAENAFGIIQDNTVLGVGDHSAENEISIYPNPAHDVVTIRLPENSSGVAISLTDLTGKTILSHKEINPIENSIIFDIQSLTVGIYFLTVIDGNSSASYTKKIIKQ